MIELKNVTKRYGSICAVDDISFKIGKGKIVGFLGQNGAGKSTTMNMITGYTSRTFGSITIDGKDILKNPKEVKQMVGYLPEQPPLYMDMTVLEYLNFVCELKNVQKKDIKAQVDMAIEMTKLNDVAKRLISNLSKGYKQRVGLAQTLCANPKIIILDEPTVGLDPNQIVEIRETIKKLGENHTVILSSHILHDIADVCKRVIIIDKGKIIADDDITSLTKDDSRGDLLIRTKGDRDKVISCFSTLEGSTITFSGTAESESNDYIITSPSEKDISSDILKIMIKNELPLLMLKPISSSLEETFLRITSKGMGV